MTLDEIYAGLSLKYLGHEGEIKLRGSIRFNDDGMEPVTIVMYDRVGCYPDHPVGSRTERRILTMQGNSPVSDLIIDYMEGW